MSLEYIWCFLIMFIASILTIFSYQKKQEVSGLFFLLVGNITAYFDFLSTETITLLFPLALLLVLMQKITGYAMQKPVLKSFCRVLSAGASAIWLPGLPNGALHRLL